MLFQMQSAGKVGMSGRLKARDTVRERAAGEKQDHGYLKGTHVKLTLDLRWTKKKFRKVLKGPVRRMKRKLSPQEDREKYQLYE